jgi:GH24 family phage-related lysozyme (muramidase)
MTGASSPTKSPYVGLRPFREEDHEFFFGRDREIRIILSNLRQPLTVLYGPSGVGKSSILQAGVVPRLKTAGAAVFYHNEWQSPDFARFLTLRFEETLQQPVAGHRLDDYLEASSKRIVVLLDQFEEYLLYHSEQSAGAEFDAVLARIVNRDDVAANVLIGIREDALYKLDQRFSIRISDLLGNTLAVQLLAPEAARSAITKPLEVLNERYCPGGCRFEIEESLVNRIIWDVQSDQVAATGISAGAAKAPTSDQRGIETAYLQLVLRRLWDQETEQSSHVLRTSTLNGMGGASQILCKHVNDVMEQFAGDGERRIAARMFRYLVTPSGTKVAQATSDLVTYAEAGGEQVRGVLDRLTDRPDARILRRLANPERYEIFHDVLAAAILEWRSRFFVAQEKAELDRIRSEEAERQQRELEQARALAREQTIAAGRLRWVLAAVAVGMAVAVALAAYAFQQRGVARKFAALADVESQQAEASKIEAQAAKAQADAERARAEAALAESRGDKDLAKRLRADEAKSQSYSAALRKEADKDQASVQTAKQALGELEQKHAAEVQGLRNQLAAASKQLQEEIGRTHSATTSIAPLQTPPATKALGSAPPQLKQFALSFEGSVPYMFRSLNGMVVIGVGHSLYSSMDAQALPFVDGNTGAPATPEQIENAFGVVASAPIGAGVTSYAKLTALRLPDAEVERLLDADLADLKASMARAFPAWGTYPEPAQLAMMDMAFHLGISGLRKYTQLLLAADRGDWAVCAEQSHVRGVSDVWNELWKALFREAAR